MNAGKQNLILAIISIAALALASFATTMALLPKNGPAIPAAMPVDTPNIAHSPTPDFGPIAPARNTPRNISFTLEAKELVAEVEPGATYQYWTFNGTVPGPFLRVLQNDTVQITIRNSGTNTHSIDLHAVIGPGGGSGLTQTSPGGTQKFKFKALHPGLYVYHCATFPIDEHITNGMYGMILVEPFGGLTPVTKEFYVMQGELYTNAARGVMGHHAFNPDKLRDGIPDYVVFNGKVGALTGPGSLSAAVSTTSTPTTIRIFFGVGGPNLPSSFHVIGEIFDKVYPEGAVAASSVIKDVQTTLVPAGGAAIVEMTALVPGQFLLVDHSLTRAIEKGAIGVLAITCPPPGPCNPTIFGPA